MVEEKIKAEEQAIEEEYKYYEKKIVQANKDKDTNPIELQFLDHKLGCLHDDFWHIGGRYPHILRSSILISSRSLMEKELKIMCESYKRKTNLSIEMSDMSGSGILDKNEKYIDRLCGYNINEFSDWATIKAINRLRNIIIHSDSKAKSNHELNKLNAINTLFSVKDQPHFTHNEIILDKSSINKFVIGIIKSFLRATSNKIFETMNDLDLLPK